MSAYGRCDGRMNIDSEAVGSIMWVAGHIVGLAVGRIAMLDCGLPRSSARPSFGCPDFCRLAQSGVIGHGSPSTVMRFIRCGRGWSFDEHPLRPDRARMMPRIYPPRWDGFHEKKVFRSHCTYIAAPQRVYLSTLAV